MERYLCIHGHFYQPPRENPWLETVELQDSAYPYHDWNERITAECYAPNATARLLGPDGRIQDIVNNYARISFNFGPTLLAWFEAKAPDIHHAIIEADRASRDRFSGHGNAIAQCYNHLIMPFAHPRDKITQVRWGIEDFQHRFGRAPEGMWLPETAADDDSLEALALHGIRFTILSPFQAASIRPLGSRTWQDVTGGHIDPSRPYLVRLPSGRTIAAFFYDAPVSKAVAFERLLTDGTSFAARLMDGYDDARDWDQLVHIATDGESYGHHHRYGEMALAYALHHIESQGLARLTNYGEYLERHPPRREVRIHQKSAWSCPHGIERWNTHCGCNSGGRPGWNQHWRFPLRQSLDWLRETLAPAFEEHARQLLRDPWSARNDYIHLLLRRTPETISAFFERHGTHPFSEDDTVTALRLLELQRHAMLMYTSCGWFFDELSGIETVQCIHYAARAIQLAQNTLNTDLEPEFLNRLSLARSNIREFRDGGRIYSRFVKPAIMTREKFGAHYAVSSLFESYPEETRIHAFTITQEHRQLLTVGNARLALGRIRARFEATRAYDTLSYGVLHLGDHNLNCGVRPYQGPEAYATLCTEMQEAFERADFPQIIRLMDRHFGESNYSLKHLFRDEQRRVLDQVLASTRNDIHDSYRVITDRYTPLIRFLADLHAPAPPALRVAVEFVRNSDLRRQFESDAIDHDRVQTLLADCARDDLPLDAETLGYALKAHLERLTDALLRTPEDAELLRRCAAAAALAGALPFEVNLWKAQNNYHTLASTLSTTAPASDTQTDPAAPGWLQLFLQLGEHLGFRTPTEPAPLP